MSELLSYSQLLATSTWREKRQQILFRDQYRCVKCGKKQKIHIEESYDMHQLRIKGEYCNISNEPGLYYLKAIEQEFLQVHHKVYRTNICPILQDNNDLITLCRNCHEKHHMEHELVVIDYKGNKIEAAETCSKCSGRGYLPKYRKVQNGICFECWGNCNVLPKKYLEWAKDAIVYPGVSHNLNVSESEILSTTEKLKAFPDLKDLNVFLNKLHALIEFLGVSSYDGNFLIIFNPFPHKEEGKSELRVRVGMYSYLAFPRPENKSDDYFNDSNLISFWEPDDIRERFEEIKEEYIRSFSAIIENGYPCSDKYNSSDFKDRHNHVIYKMAIDYDFRLRIIEQLQQ